MGRVVRTYVGGGAAGEAAAAADRAERSRRRDLRRRLIDEQRADLQLVPASLGDLVRRARAGEAGALAAVERELERRPGEASRLVPGALSAWLDRRAGGDPVVRAALGRQVDELRGGLAGPDPSSLELLLVERVLVAWVALEWGETAYLHGLVTDHLPKQAEYWSKRADAFHRRFLAACRGLAQVQRSDLGVVLQRIADHRA